MFEGVFSSKNQSGYDPGPRPEKENLHPVAVIVDIESPENSLVQSVEETSNDANGDGLGRADPPDKGKENDEHWDCAADRLAGSEVFHVLNICRKSGIVVGVFQDAWESNVVGVCSQTHIVDRIGQFYCVPKFFCQEVELNGEGQHYKI